MTTRTSFVVVLALALSAAAVVAQPRASSPPPAGPAPGGKGEVGQLKTIVEVDVIIPSVGAGAEVQEWGRFFQTLGISAQLRQGNRDERPATTESVRGTLRTVRVVGRLDPRGTVLFDSRKFTTADREKVKEWLDELRVYGAQGTPDGKPLWGLDKTQFDEIFETLSRPTTTAFVGMTLKEALAAADWTMPYPLRIHTTATEAVADAAPLRVNPLGLAKGTALAALLADQRLGFRPERTPSGTIELVIQPLSMIPEPWPVGWPLDPDKPRHLVAPTYFQNGQVDFEQVPLKTVLEACSERTATPILIDYPRCLAKSIDPTMVMVSHPAKKLAYALVVNTVVHQARLSLSLKLDEGGMPFVHVYPFDPKPLPAK